MYFFLLINHLRNYLLLRDQYFLIIESRGIFSSFESKLIIIFSNRNQGRNYYYNYFLTIKVESSIILHFQRIYDSYLSIFPDF